MCQQYGIKPLHTAVYFQRENPVERKVAELKKILRTVQYNEHPKDNWDTYVQKALNIIRTRKNRATGMTPAKALLGYELPRRGQWNIPTYQKQRHEQRNAQRDAKARRQVIRARQLNFNEKEYPNQDETPPVTFRRGDMVMVKENAPTGPFEPVWSGPHSVEQRKSPQIIEVDKNGRIFKYHVDQLRPAPPGNTEDPNDSESEDGDDTSERLNADTAVSSDEEDGLPQLITTTAIVHAAPRTRAGGEPADNEVEHRVPSPSGKLAPVRRVQEEDGIQIAERTEPLDLTLDPSAIDPPAIDPASERPGDPPRPAQAPDIVVFRRPRRRIRPHFQQRLQGVININSDSAGVSDPNQGPCP